MEDLMRHYIPTLEQCAIAIIDNNDYELYKKRRRLLDTYSTGTPIKVEKKERYMTTDECRMDFESDDGVVAKEIRDFVRDRDRKTKLLFDFVGKYYGKNSDVMLDSILGCNLKKKRKREITLPFIESESEKEKSLCPVCDEKILQNDDSSCFTCERHVCHQCIGQTRKVSGNSFGMVSVYTFCNDCLGRDTDLLRGREKVRRG